MSHAFLAAVKAAGIADEVADYNNGPQEGAGPIQMSVTPGGRRADAFNAFVEPQLRAGHPGQGGHAARLEVVSEAFVRRIVLSEGGGAAPRATGVELELGNGDVVRVEAKREVAPQPPSQHPHPNWTRLIGTCFGGDLQRRGHRNPSSPHAERNRAAGSS